MVWLIILLALALQYFMNLNSSRFRINWVEPYVDYCCNKFSRVVNFDSLFGYALLAMPAAVVSSFILILLSWLLPHFMYQLVGGVFFWGVTNISKMKESKLAICTHESLMQHRIQYLFSPIFFYALSPGPLLLSYYVIFRGISNYQVAGSINQELDSQEEFPFFYWINWFPVKCLGLTFAIVGHFKSVIVLWRERLFSRSSHAKSLSMLSSAALSLGSRLEVSTSESSGGNTRLSNELCEHALLVWLLVIFVINLAAWLG